VVGDASWGWHLHPVYWEASMKRRFALPWVAAFGFALAPHLIASAPMKAASARRYRASSADGFTHRSADRSKCLLDWLLIVVSCWAQCWRPADWYVGSSAYGPKQPL